MPKALVKAVALTVSLVSPAASTPGSGLAGMCDAPVVDWQPRETLRALLEAAGWQVRAIMVRDGCYAVLVAAEGGRETDMVFDPRTLQVVDDEQ